MGGHHGATRWRVTKLLTRLLLLASLLTRCACEIGGVGSIGVLRAVVSSREGWRTTSREADEAKYSSSSSSSSSISISSSTSTTRNEPEIESAKGVSLPLLALPSLSSYPPSPLPTLSSLPSLRSLPASLPSLPSILPGSLPSLPSLPAMPAMPTLRLPGDFLGGLLRRRGRRRGGLLGVSDAFALVGTDLRTDRLLDACDAFLVLQRAMGNSNRLVAVSQ